MIETFGDRDSAFRVAWASDAADRVWAITPDAFEHIFDALRMAAVSEAPEAVGRRPGRPPKIQGGVATVGLKGVLMPGMGLLEALFGIESGLKAFQRDFQQAAGDSDVGAIVMDIDSPGGLVDQIPETAQMIRDARQSKQIVAVSNTLTASAAYWLASQANEIVVTPSGEVGSIGVYATHRDMSGAFEQRGIKHTLVSAGKYKTEGNPYGPLDGDGVKALQESVDDYYNMFVKDVATGRGVSVADVKSGFGEGRVLTAKRSVDAGLADRVDSLGGVVSNLSRRSRSPETVSAESEVEYTSEEKERLVHTLANL